MKILITILLKFIATWCRVELLRTNDEIVMRFIHDLQTDITKFLEDAQK